MHFVSECVIVDFIAVGWIILLTECFIDSFDAISDADLWGSSASSHQVMSSAYVVRRILYEILLAYLLFDNCTLQL